MAKLSHREQIIYLVIIELGKEVRKQNVSSVSWLLLITLARIRKNNNFDV